MYGVSVRSNVKVISVFMLQADRSSNSSVGSNVASSPIKLNVIVI